MPSTPEFLRSGLGSRPRPAHSKCFWTKPYSPTAPRRIRFWKKDIDVFLEEANEIRTGRGGRVAHDELASPPGGGRVAIFLCLRSNEPLSLMANFTYFD